MKVSREGIVLIKSFAGFRSRAVRADAGCWVIGYGHTASARSGLTVSESDAELLLQYDLVPVVKALNAAVTGTINQHQFDALASFALSIGVDRFLSSDVLRRFRAGQAELAAEALIGWPDDLPPDAASRRRAAERALFRSAPDQPVHLFDLLSAALPVAAREPAAACATATAARVAAVATLLGEGRPDEDETPTLEAVRTEKHAFAASETATSRSSPPERTDETPPAPAARATMSAAAPSAPEPGPDIATEPSPAQTDDPDPDTTDNPPKVLETVAAQPVFRHEREPAGGPRFDRDQTRAYLVMGGTGLIALIVAVVVFQLARLDPTAMERTTAVAWILALVGSLCVAASAISLLVRLRRSRAQPAE